MPMSGYNDLKKCPVCRTENSLAISGDWKPYDYEHGHCHECGFTHQTKFYRMTLEQLNDYRKHLNEIYEEGLEPLKIVIEAHPDYSAAYLLLGKTWEKLSNREEAIEIYKQGIAAASKKGDLMPLKDMQNRMNQLLQSSP